MGRDEHLGHIVKIEEEEEAEDDALDAALEMELAATYVKYPVASQVEPAEPSKPTLEEIATAEIQEPTTTSSQLSFAFPGWEVDMSKGAQRKMTMPSTSRYSNGPQSIAPNKKGKQVKRSSSRRASSSLALDDPSTPMEGCPIDLMDDELLACVFMRLNVKDLCSSMRTCKRWHRVACKEDVWEHIPLPANVPGALPRYFVTGLYERLLGFAPRLGSKSMSFRWMEIRNAGTSMDLRGRFQVFRRGYEFVRSALHAWWDHGKPDPPHGKHPSAIFRSVTQKLVINDWSLLYEALGAGFSDRADRIAVIILAAVQRIELSRHSKDRGPVTDAQDDAGTGLAEMFLNLPSTTDGDSNVMEGCFWDEFEVQEIWVLVLSLWRRYTTWLTLVVSHCPELNHEVMAERARSNALAMTPTVYGKGIICFRSQIILKYGIRSSLQTTWSGLASAKRSGIASDNQLDLFRAADHLFQETSVLDDLTLSPSTFTQQKLRRCFRNEASGKTKPRGKPDPTALN